MEPTSQKRIFGNTSPSAHFVGGARMHDVISPALILGGSRSERPAYLSSGVIGLRVRDNPLAAG
jgi:hypothetical protein